MKIQDIINYKNGIIEDIEELKAGQQKNIEKYFIELSGLLSFIISGFFTLVVLWVSAMLNPYTNEYAFQILSTFAGLSISIFAALLLINWQIKKAVARCYKM